MQHLAELILCYLNLDAIGQGVVFDTAMSLTKHNHAKKAMAKLYLLPDSLPHSRSEASCERPSNIDKDVAIVLSDGPTEGK